LHALPHRPSRRQVHAVHVGGQVIPMHQHALRIGPSP
jgi:hypothetical protein